VPLVAIPACPFSPVKFSGLTERDSPEVTRLKFARFEKSSSASAAKSPIDEKVNAIQYKRDFISAIFGLFKASTARQPRNLKEIKASSPHGKRKRSRSGVAGSRIFLPGNNQF
jgi:hypothetical protein